MRGMVAALLAVKVHAWIAAILSSQRSFVGFVLVAIKLFCAA
jgi:hypothetical protein